MSASLKDPHGQTDDPSLNGGRTPRKEQQHVPGHFAANIGVIVFLVLAAVIMFFCTACGPADTDSAQKKVEGLQASASSTHNGAKNIKGLITEYNKQVM